MLKARTKEQKSEDTLRTNNITLRALEATHRNKGWE